MRTTMWEKRTDAIRGVLGAKQIIRTDELRRAIESIEPGRYEQLSYYERWIVAVEILLVEKGLLTREEIDRKMAEWSTCQRLRSGSHARSQRVHGRGDEHGGQV